MKNNKPTVCVFMSCYNGEHFIKQQIDSILNQEDVETFIYIRDDGSKDNTKQVLESYDEYNKHIFVTFGSNIGFEHSFAEISRMKAFDYDYYAFSDQDDSWMLNRLVNAIKQIKEKDNDGRHPVLYGSNFFITDGELNVEKSLYTKKQAKRLNRKMAKYGFFYENMYGCTMVWNKTFNSILLEHKPIARASQDTWSQIVAETTGATVIFDENETIYHRIHSSNTAGIQKGFIKKIKKGFRIYIHSGISTKGEIVKEISDAYSSYETENSKKKKIRLLVKDYPHSFTKKMRLVWLTLITTQGLQRKIFRSYLLLRNKF